MLHREPFLRAVAAHAGKPAVHAVVERDAPAVCHERLPVDDDLPLGALHHAVHIRKIPVHRMFRGQPVGFLPEPRDVIADILDIALRLHVVRGQRPVKIVAERDDGPFISVHLFPPPKDTARARRSPR